VYINRRDSRFQHLLTIVVYLSVDDVLYVVFCFVTHPTFSLALVLLRHRFSDGYGIDN
jgi:hypothetical protein